MRREGAGEYHPRHFMRDMTREVEGPGFSRSVEIGTPNTTPRWSESSYPAFWREGRSVKRRGLCGFDSRLSDRLGGKGL
jgi:hypothetical protein